MAGIEKMKESRLINFIQFSDCANFYKTSKQTKSHKVVCIHTIHMTTWLACVLFGTPFVKFQSHIFCAEEGECILLHVAWKHPLSPCHQKVLTSLPVALWTGEIKFKANPIPPIAKWKTEEIHPYRSNTWPWFKQSSNRLGDVLNCEAMRQWPTTLLVLIQHQINGRR